MNTFAVGMSRSSTPSNTNVLTRAATALWMHSTCCATTDRTSSSMRLNSSKHAHAPDAARPLKNLPIAL